MKPFSQKFKPSSLSFVTSMLLFSSLATPLWSVCSLVSGQYVCTGPTAALTIDTPLTSTITHL